MLCETIGGVWLCSLVSCVNLLSEHSGVEDGSSEVHGEPAAARSVCDSAARCFVR